MEKIGTVLRRIVRGVSRRTMSFFELRPTSFPFISGDGFRSIATHLFEPNNTSLSGADVKKNDVIFVESSMLDVFFAEVHTNIQHRYILISHNGDKNITSSYLEHFTDKKIIHWFAQNVLIAHPSLTPLPIGLENARLANIGSKKLYQKRFFDLCKEASSKLRIPQIIYGFSVGTNPKERTLALEALKRTRVATPVNSNGKMLPQKSYLELLSSSCFVASPEGNGHDCHRTWEAMYVGTVPIVHASESMIFFRSIGLPLFVIDNWNEIRIYGKADILNLFEEITKKSSIEPLLFSYWKKRILDTKEAI